MIIDYKNKYKYLITEGTYKQLANILQSQFLNKIGKKTYKELDDQQKKDLNIFITSNQLKYKQDVENITNNIYYQSWIYNVLISGEQKFPEDFDKIKQAINDFIKISRSSKLTNEQKDIKFYKNFSELHKFLYEFKQQYTQYKPLDYDLFYQNNTYAVYKIMSKNFGEFSKLLKDLNIAWCVKNRSYFNRYGAPYYMIVEKSTNKPYALLHINSHQLKDIHDYKLQDNSDEIIDVLSQFIDLGITWTGDLNFYNICFLKKDNPNISDSELFCVLYPKFEVNEQGLIKPININSTESISHDMLAPFIINDKLSITFIPNKSIIFFTELDKTLNVNNLKNFNFSISQMFQYIIGPFGKLNDDGSFDLMRDITICKDSPYIKDGKLLIKFKNSKTFNISNCDLVTLENCPENVDGYFNCAVNKLTSLQYCPKYVKYEFNCSGNPLKSLDYLPEQLYKLDCKNTNIIDLHSNSIKELKNLDCQQNQSLISLNINYKVKNLDISYCKNIQSFNGLTECNLNKINITNTNIDRSKIPPNVLIFPRPNTKE